RQAFADTLRNIRTITGALVEPSMEVNDVVANANKALVELNSFFQHLDQSYTDKGGLKEQLSQTLADADRLAKNFNHASRQCQLDLKKSRPGLRNFTESRLIQVSDILTDLQRFVAGATRFVSEMERTPTRLLFGDRGEGSRPQ